MSSKTDPCSVCRAPTRHWYFSPTTGPQPLCERCAENQLVIDARALQRDVDLQVFERALRAVRKVSKPS